MEIEEQIDAYIASHPAPKRADMQTLHDVIRGSAEGLQLWFLDGRNEEGKVVSNPSIGYGVRTTKYADGSSREFYRVGLSANTSGISVYILGIDDKKHLAETYAPRLGKATVTGYCIKFRKLADIDLGVLTEAVRYGLKLA